MRAIAHAQLARCRTSSPGALTMLGDSVTALEMGKPYDMYRTEYRVDVTHYLIYDTTRF